MKRYSIYVVELSRRVWTDSARFRRENPQFNGVLECLYVGMTSRTPKTRFQQHKTGYRNKRGIKISSYFVEKYGMYLRPSLYNHLGKLTRAEALEMEKQLTLDLRKQRYAVWSN